MEDKKVARAGGMLKHDEKVHIVALKEEGLHRSSIDPLLAKMRNLPKFTISTAKRALAGSLR